MTSIAREFSDDDRPPEEAAHRIAVPGRNCWRLCRAARAAFLVDGAAYFSAFEAAAMRAERSIVILGWDIDSRIALRRTDDGGQALRLGEFLAGLVRARRSLHVYILGWDFPLLLAKDREPLPRVAFGLKMPRRVHFHLDATLAGPASTHQKIVVVDGRVAFVGGMDLTSERWDTPEHRAEDPRRVGARGPYGPFHDVMLAVDGAAAASLAELARERWALATGRVPRRTRPGVDTWPPGLEPDLRDVEVAIARTVPETEDAPEVREVERLYLDAIRAARRTIYVENQFLSSSLLGDALARRLAEPHGPEIVIVISRQSMSWLEESTMGVLRARLLRRLAAEDVHGRLRVYDPLADGRADVPVKVHSKVMIVDDRFVRVGSSNLNNRSLGVDPECDLAIEPAGDPRVARTIASFRNRLLAEHLHVTGEEVERAHRETGSLIAAIELLRRRHGTLEPLTAAPPPWLEQVVPDESVIDPPQPPQTAALVSNALPAPGALRALRLRVRRPTVLIAATVIGVLALAVLWKFTRLGAWLDPRVLAHAASHFKSAPEALVAVTLGFLVLSFLSVPVNLLTFATALAFGPLHGLVYSAVGTVVSAAFNYWAGVALGGRVVTKALGPRSLRVRESIRTQGVIPIALVRMVPIAPFLLVNLAAGAARVPFRNYMLGSVLGMAPGTVAITVFGDQLGAMLRDPHPVRLLTIVGVLFAMMLLGWFVRRTARRRREAREDAAAS